MNLLAMSELMDFAIGVRGWVYLSWWALNLLDSLSHDLLLRAGSAGG